MFVQAFFIPQSTMPPFPPSCKRALAPSAAIRKEGAIEEEEEGKVEVKGEEKGLPSALSLFVLLAVVTPASGGGQEKKEGKKKRWRKAALLLLLLLLHSLIASMTGRPQLVARPERE